MAFEIKLGVNASPKNAVTKDVTYYYTYTGTLKESTSIIDPVFLIECNLSDVYRANYMTVTAFGRHYFITNIRSVRANLVEFSCHVDVLYSYKDYILQNEAIVKRNENTYNILLNDGFFKVYQNPHIVMYEFPTGFTEHEFILAMAGSG